MPSATGNKAIALFFLVFGIFLAIFIVTQGLDIYQNSKGFVNEQEPASIECDAFFYEITGITYELDELSMSVENLRYGKDILNLTVIGNDRKFLPILLPVGTTQQLRVGLDVGTNFTVYPGNCAIFQTTCILETGECTYTGVT